MKPMRWLVLFTFASLIGAACNQVSSDAGNSVDAGPDVANPAVVGEVTDADADADVIDVSADVFVPVIDGGSCPEPSPGPPTEVTTRTPELTAAVAAIHALRPDLAYIQLLRSEYTIGGQAPVGDGPYFRAFKTDTGYDIALVRGAGDCAAGCTIHEYWYFEVATQSDGGFTVMPVGHYDPGADHDQSCSPDAGTPMWNIPPAPNCFDAGSGIPDFSGTRSFCASGSIGTCDSNSLTTRIITADITQKVDDAGHGTLTLHGTGSADLDDKTFDATITQGAIHVFIQDMTGTGQCIDTRSLTIQLAFTKKSANGTIDLDTTHTTSCPDSGVPPYCKASTSFRIVATP